MKKSYDTDSIFFGNYIYNTGKDGFYHASALAFEKLEDGTYRELKRIAAVPVYQKGTDEYLTVTNLYPLSNIIKEKEVSSSMIKLQLLRYNLFNKNSKVIMNADKIRKNK